MNLSADNLKLQLMSIRSQAIDTLIGNSSSSSASGSANSEQTADFADILAAKGSALSADGRNSSLRDPESAFQMMTRINRFDVDFKAQYAELDAMGGSVAQLETRGRDLSDIDNDTASSEIVAQLQQFVADYNSWEDRFDDTVANGGVLDNVQAAEVSLYELEQSIKNIFNGAADGVRGLADLGITIDPVTHQASLDVGRLESVLASNKTGAVNAIDQFSENFAKSAELLNADNNFIQRALDNRSRAIDYIATNKSDLQQEFGTGAAAKPEGEVARALSAYNNAFNLS